MDPDRPSKADVLELLRTLNSTNIQKTVLISICLVNGLAKSGNKPDLLVRITQAVHEAADQQDLDRFRLIRETVFSRLGKPVPSSPLQQSSPSSSSAAAIGTQPSNMQSTYGSSALSQYLGSNGHGTQSYSNGGRAQGSHFSFSQNFSFKKSPFYDPKTRIGDVKTCEPMSQHRNTVQIPIKAHEAAMIQTQDDPTMKIMILMAGGNSGIQDIAFPHQSELKVNGQEIKANIRGLKGKPGSTRPVDITSALRFKPTSYQNTVEFTYALTTKRYYMGVYLCKTVAVPVLVEQIRAHGKRISKASVVSELNSKANDPDVVATSQVLSLKCPLSYMRLDIPCRGISCTHIQCFDAGSYLQLQEQGPQWICPICNKSAPFEQLAVDDYMMDILANTNDSIDQITIEPNGQWISPSAQQESVTRSIEPRQSISIDDDGLILLDAASEEDRALFSFDQLSSRVSTPKTNGTSHLPTPNLGTPGYGTPGVGTPSRSGPGTSNKRPAPQVIDLTLSDDDDEPSEPPLKRLRVANGFEHDY